MAGIPGATVGDPNSVLCINDALCAAHNDSQSWLLQTGTVLERTDSNWEFSADDYNGYGRPDVLGVKKQAPTNRTEVHVLSGETTFQQFALQTITGLGPTDGNWQFEFAEWNGDNILDLFAIRKQPGGVDPRTEVHIYSGAGPNCFQTWLGGWRTALGPTDANFEFAVVGLDLQGKPDLLAIKKQGGAGGTEVQAFSGESGLVTPIDQTATPLEFSNAYYTFEAGDHNYDGTPDLFVLKFLGANSVEVHILFGAPSANGHRFQDWLLHTGTPLPWIFDRNYWAFGVADWDGNGSVDLVVIKKIGASSTEVHVLRGERISGWAASQRGRSGRCLRAPGCPS